MTDTITLNVRRVSGDGLIIERLGQDGAIDCEYVVADLGRKTLVVGRKIDEIIREAGLWQR